MVPPLRVIGHNIKIYGARGPENVQGGKQTSNDKFFELQKCIIRNDFTLRGSSSGASQREDPE